MVSMATKPAITHAGLPPEKLRWSCDPARIPFDTTAQAEPLDGVIGQDRALRALKMGVELPAPGYNVFVCGLAGTSRGGMISRMIEELQPTTKLSPDRCYVNNFKNPDRPRLLTLPPGQANAFKKDMQSGIEFLRRRIPQVFEGEPFQRQKGRIVDRFTVRETSLPWVTCRWALWPCLKFFPCSKVRWCPLRTSPSWSTKANLRRWPPKNSNASTSSSGRSSPSFTARRLRFPASLPANSATWSRRQPQCWWTASLRN